MKTPRSAPQSSDEDLREALEAALGEAADFRHERDLARGQVRFLRTRLETALSGVRDLEDRHSALLTSRTWRVMEFFRRLTGREAPGPYVPLSPSGASAPEAKKTEGAELYDRLWGGFSAQALADLEVMATATSAGRINQAEAAWGLARFHATRGDYTEALQNIRRIEAVDPDKWPVMRCLLLEADCLMRLGGPETARTRLHAGLIRKPGSADLFLALANSYLHDPDLTGAEQDTQRLAWISRIFTENGFQPLVKTDPEKPLSMGNIEGTGLVHIPARGQPQISVIMPAFSVADTLAEALQSVLNQTWRNLEVIVVDDCSPDATLAVAQGIAATDARVKVLSQSSNQGCYAARNAGLQVARGDFITIHDADDWSHPQKLETQVRQLLDTPGLVGTFSDWVRSTPDLRAVWEHRPSGVMVRTNMSSIMLRREACNAPGGWDGVRFGADTDFFRRAEILYGTQALGRAARGVPLSFGRQADGSLTRQGASHIRTLQHGARRDYNEASQFWRAGADPRDLCLPADGTARPFPVPLSLMGRGDDVHEADVLFIADFCDSGDATLSALTEAEVAYEAGRVVAVFHWRLYGQDVTRPLHRRLRQAAQDGKLRIVTPGEKIRTRTVIISNPEIVAYPVDLFPEVTTGNLLVIVNRMAAGMYDGGNTRYDPLVLRDNLRGMFGSEGIWMPVSGLVRCLMHDDPRYPVPADGTWTPLINSIAAEKHVLPWRGAKRRRPVIGRHVRGENPESWPTAPALQQAWCAGMPCRVEIMGGGKTLGRLLGEIPGNWKIRKPSEMKVRTFLRRLDFYVHHAHGEYVEEFPYPVTGAMALGLPVVLSPVFRDTFGDAAVYAEPQDVWREIEALWPDEAAWTAQGRRGREFVCAHCNRAGFPDRPGHIASQAHSPATAGK